MSVEAVSQEGLDIVRALLIFLAIIAVVLVELHFRGRQNDLEARVKDLEDRVRQ